MPTPDEQILTIEQIAEIEVRKAVQYKTMVYLTVAERDALCRTVRQLRHETSVLREDLKYRCEALEELRRCRDRWLTMLRPASADETVDGAIRNLQQAYVSERDNAIDLQSQLEQLRAENEGLRDELRAVQALDKLTDRHIRDDVDGAIKKL